MRIQSLRPHTNGSELTLSVASNLTPYFRVKIVKC